MDKQESTRKQMNKEQREEIRSVLIYNSNGVTNYDPIIDQIESILTPKQEAKSTDDLKDATWFLTSRIDNEAEAEDVAQVMIQYAQLRTQELEERIKELEDELKQSNYDPDFNG